MDSADKDSNIRENAKDKRCVTIMGGGEKQIGPANQKQRVEERSNDKRRRLLKQSMIEWARARINVRPELAFEEGKWRCSQ